MQINKKYIPRPISLMMAAVILLSFGVAIATQAQAPDEGLVQVFDYAQRQIEKEESIVDGLTAQQRAAQIDNYFAERNLPLAGYGEKFVSEADKYEIDWRLAPAISMAESTGFQYKCSNPNGQFNPFGYGSCKIGFSSLDQSIEVITEVLGGEHEKSGHYYAGKDTKEILETWNPPHIAPGYSNKVIAIMDDISSQHTKFAFNY